MKKFLLIATCILFAIPATFAQYVNEGMAKQKNVPPEIQSVVDEMQDEIGVNDEGITLTSVAIEGKNIVMTMELDESEFVGMSFIEAFEYAGINMDEFSAGLKAEILSDNEGHDVLRKYKYNMVMRMVGSISRETFDVVISYKEFK